MTEPRIWTITSDERFLSGGITLVGPEAHSGTRVVEEQRLAELLERLLKLASGGPVTTETDIQALEDGEALLAALRACQGKDAVKHESRPSA